ncbi:MAG TPA: zinc-dependent metalloprotease family protein, partial [Blastocatellia bacterium]|nr:zinc-dependent metalloprotease family protein [Blastocatellia bacterium]
MTILFSITGAFLLAQPVYQAGGPQRGSGSPDGMWQQIDEAGLDRSRRAVNASSYVVLRLNRELLAERMAQAPLEFSSRASTDQVLLSIPMPDGSFSTYKIELSPIMEPGLAAQFPEIKTYRGQGIEDPSSTTRFGWTSAGFHAIVFTSQGTVYVDPYGKDDTENYLSYYKLDYQKQEQEFKCLFTDPQDGRDALRDAPLPAVLNGQTLKTYRLALAATGEYTQFFGGTVAGAMSGMTTTMNRVNGIYERDLAVRMVLVANQASIIYTNSATDPYSNFDGFAMLGQNQANLDLVIGTANYDVGHVFSTGGGGIASLGVICSTSNKARGVTGLPSPSGDVFDVDFVSHEMGHQFGGRHTFNGSAGNCSGANRSPSAAYEPGSGSTIQAYAGICGSQNLQPNSDDYFHVRSLEEMLAHINGSGGACAGQTATGNTIPTVNAGLDYTIPKQTPFTLTASAVDPNGDSLTYCWEEYDLGPASPPDSDSDGNARPIFRSFDPVSSPSRTFPKLANILSNTTTIGESLPNITRTMNFQVTVRDNRAGGGAVASDAMQVNVSGASGPFLITSPNTSVSWAAGTIQSVSWDVASTNASPVNCAAVKISLSTDGGLTFPITIAASTPNDGSHSFTVPSNLTSSARLKV